MAAGAVLIDAHRVSYYTGFAFIPTERPIAFVLAADGRDGMLVPRLEVEHARANADQDGYPGILGYAGPALSGVSGATVALLGDAIESMLRIKSPAELALIRESGRWCAHAHRLLQEYTRPGATEAEASLRAGHETTLAMLAELGEVGGMSSSAGASAKTSASSDLASSMPHSSAARRAKTSITTIGSRFSLARISSAREK